MIRTKDAIATARSLLGTAYSEMDCIALIREVVKRAEGGVPNYRCQGTNWLWDSVNNAARYRHLIWRRESLSGAQAGMLAFKRRGDDVHHVGLVTGEGTVIHSSSARGQVVETPLDGSWNLLGIHRYIEAASTSEEEEGEEAMLYQAVVTTERDPLRVRAWAQTGRILGTVPRGAVVDVLTDSCDGWPRIQFNELLGYASAEYLERIEDAPESSGGQTGETTGRAETTTLISDDGVIVTLIGHWGIADD